MGWDMASQVEVLCRQGICTWHEGGQNLGNHGPASRPLDRNLELGPTSSTCQCGGLEKLGKVDQGLEKLQRSLGQVQQVCASVIEVSIAAVSAKRHILI